jgi:hypothetical protein
MNLVAGSLCAILGLKNWLNVKHRCNSEYHISGNSRAKQKITTGPTRITNKKNKIAVALFVLMVKFINKYFWRINVTPAIAEAIIGHENRGPETPAHPAGAFCLLFVPDQETVARF